MTPALLQALGIEFVKIDGLIVQKVHCDSMRFAMAREISHACRNYGIRTIGQLVELPETVQILRNLDVDYVQGYGIAVPEPLDQ
jgi:EAL domain-containing protein (putative c-di-GMP-specific phosphodiesterase class I)